MIFNTLAVSALLAAASVSSLIISPEPMSRNMAVKFCAEKNVHLADVTSVNKDDVNSQLAGKKAWIGSWDNNFHNNECLYRHNNHVGTTNCDDKLFAACNNLLVYKSTRDVEVNLVQRPINELTEEIVDEIFGREEADRLAVIAEAEALPTCAEEVAESVEDSKREL